MSQRTLMRTALADFIRTTLDDDDLVVTRSVPTTLRAASIHIAPQDPYTKHRGEGAGTFKKPAVFLRVVVIAPAFESIEGREDWLEERLDLLSRALHGTAKVGAYSCPKVANSRQAILAEDQSLLGMLIDLTPVEVSIDAPIT